MNANKGKYLYNFMAWWFSVEHTSPLNAWFLFPPPYPFLWNMFVWRDQGLVASFANISGFRKAFSSWDTPLGSRGKKNLWLRKLLLPFLQLNPLSNILSLQKIRIWFWIVRSWVASWTVTLASSKSFLCGFWILWRGVDTEWYSVEITCEKLLIITWFSPFLRQFSADATKMTS